jgi:DNA-directed RNA polymerase specialized sigma24 family protein
MAERTPREHGILHVQESAHDLQVATDGLHEDIREARRLGASLREIAEAAGVSYETVRRILGK